MFLMFLPFKEIEQRNSKGYLEVEVVGGAGNQRGKVIPTIKFVRNWECILNAVFLSELLDLCLILPNVNVIADKRQDQN